MHGSRLRADDGFTLVELLVAILIIGVLAAVGLSAFLNQRVKAQDAEAKAAVTTAAKAMLAYSTDHDNSFAGATPSALAALEPALGHARGLAVTSTAHRFTVTVESASGGGAAFSIQHTDDGSFVRDCTKPDTGGCRPSQDASGNRW